MQVGWVVPTCRLRLDECLMDDCLPKISIPNIFIFRRGLGEAMRHRGPV